MARWLRSLFFAFPGWLDEKLRWADLRAHRIDETVFHRGTFLRGYSPTVLWLPVFVLLFLAYGLPRWRGIELVLLCFVAFLFHLWICAYKARPERARQPERVLPWWQFGLLSVLALGVFLWAGTSSREIAAAPYRHIFAGFGTLVLFLGMVLGRWWTDSRISKYRDELGEHFATRLGDTQLFVYRHDPPEEWHRVLRALALVPISSLWLLLIVPAIAVLVADREGVWFTFWAALALAWVLLAAAHYQQRLSMFRELMTQLLFNGGTAVVSLIVILLAALRLGGLDYVTTVLDQRSQGVLVFFVVMLYVLFWLYEYWMQRALAESLLGLLSDGDDDHPASIPYRRLKRPTDRTAGVEEGRLQIHGGGRLIAILEKPNEHYKEQFQTHPPLEVFRRIHRQLEGRARVGMAKWSEVNDVSDALHSLEQKVRLSRIGPAIVLLAIVVFGGIAVFQQTQKPGLTVDVAKARARSAFSLDRALVERANEPEVYAVAASGGGTRAALYTYAVLRALARHEVVDRVVMGSGVSGGSLGLAYFGVHRDELLESPAGEGTAAWDCYREAMAAQYIRDVLAGAGEGRFVTGTRLGHLLIEAFERELVPAERPSGCQRAPRPTFGRQSDVGLVFNSSVAGIWNAADREARDCLSHAGKMRKCASIAERGSRFATTNIGSFVAEEVASMARKRGWELDLSYGIARSDEIPFTAAAALSANFPPVFSNAAVDLLDQGRLLSRYWVTDGGAIENRGLLSQLLALNTELAAARKVRRRAAGEGGESVAAPYPPLKVIVAEASGSSTGYREDRGAGAKFGGSGEIAEKLIGELVLEADQRYRALTRGRARVEVVYLPLPDALRRGFGTHWQMPEEISVSPPDAWYRDDDGVTVPKEELLAATDLLFTPDAKEIGPFDPDSAEGAEWNRLLWEAIDAGSDGGAGEPPAKRLREKLDLPD